MLADAFVLPSNQQILTALDTLDTHTRTHTSRLAGWLPAVSSLSSRCPTARLATPTAIAISAQGGTSSDSKLTVNTSQDARA